MLRENVSQFWQEVTSRIRRWQEDPGDRPETAAANLQPAPSEADVQPQVSPQVSENPSGSTSRTAGAPTESRTAGAPTEEMLVDVPSHEERSEPRASEEVGAIAPEQQTDDAPEPQFLPVEKLPIEELPIEELPAPLPKPAQGNFPLTLLLLTGSLVICGGMVAGTGLWLLRTPPVPSCDGTRLESDGELLYCAQEIADSGRLADLLHALKLLDRLSPTSPLSGAAAQLRDEWSQLLLTLARQRLAASQHLQEAAAIARNVPPSSPVLAEAQAAIAEWRTEWERGKSLYDEAQRALQQQEWKAATEIARELPKLPYEPWRSQQYEALVAQIPKEQEAWKQLEAVRAIIRQGVPATYREAINRAAGIPMGTYAREVAQEDVSQWGRRLLDLVAAELQEGDTPAAIALAELIPDSTYLHQSAQIIIRFTKAQVMAWGDSQVTLGDKLPAQLLLFVDAQNVASEVRWDSSVHREAEIKLALWTEHTEDLVQLQYAQFLASFGQPTALQGAIALASTIGEDRPRRTHAQTLIAYWQSELKKIQDRPMLQEAMALAGDSTKPAYEAAIAKASEISPEHPLRIEAQTLIAHWNKQIQILEDRKILDRAIDLAKQQDYTGAIAKVGEIAADRAIYPEVEAHIKEWQTAILTAQDRERLNRAKQARDEGSFSDAIWLASRIDASRPLHQEAQAAIAQWREEWEAALKADEQP